MESEWVVYLLECGDGSLYCGVTNNLKKRVRAHNLGKGAKYTRSRMPVKLVAASRKMAKNDAFRFEYRVKQLPSRKKAERLLSGPEIANPGHPITLNEIRKELEKVAYTLRELADIVARTIGQL